MAALRAFGILLALIGFFLIGAPLQSLIVRKAPRAAARIPVFFCRSLLWLLGVHVAVKGGRVSDHPVMMVANHVSWIDILALGAVTPFCFLAKREVGSWPILSAFAKVQGTVFVDRARRRTILHANRQMAARMQQGRTVLLFPEGTTVGGGEPGPFRSSHFAAARDFLRATLATREVDVQPVALAYSSPAAAWVGDEALLPHLWRTLRAPPLICSITFASPIAYRADTDRKQVAARSRTAILETLEQHRGLSPGSQRATSHRFDAADLADLAEATS